MSYFYVLWNCIYRRVNSSPKNHFGESNYKYNFTSLSPNYIKLGIRFSAQNHRAVSY